MISYSLARFLLLCVFLQDPSIQQITRNTTSLQQTLDDYRPFDNDRNVLGNGSGASQPATLHPSTQSPPVYNQSGAQFQTNSNGAMAASGSKPDGMTQISTAELEVGLESVCWLIPTGSQDRLPPWSAPVAHARHVCTIWHAYPANRFL